MVGKERIPLFVIWIVYYQEYIFPNLLPLFKLSNALLCYQSLNADFCQTGLSPTFPTGFEKGNLDSSHWLRVSKQSWLHTSKPLHLISSIWTEYARGVGTVTNGRRLPWKPSKTCPYQLRAYKSLSFPAHLTLASVFMPWFALFPKIRPVLSWCMAKDLFYRWLYQLGSIPAPDNCVILSQFKHIIPHLLSNELFQKLHWRTEVPLAFWFLHAS